MATEKITIEHKDKLGRILNVGDAVCYAHHNSLEFGVIKKLNPKMVKVSNQRWSGEGSNKYPCDVVKVEGPDVSIYLLKMNSAR